MAMAVLGLCCAAPQSEALSAQTRLLCVLGGITDIKLTQGKYLEIH